jgi:hypothetical protein
MSINKKILGVQKMDVPFPFINGRTDGRDMVGNPKKECEKELLRRLKFPSANSGSVAGDIFIISEELSKRLKLDRSVIISKVLNSLSLLEINSQWNERTY